MRLGVSCLTALVCVGTTWAAGPKLEDYVQDDIRDFRLKVHATHAKRGELIKISKDFAAAYQILQGTATVYYKEPSKVRIDGAIDKTRMLYIVNGDRKLVSIPSVRLKQVEDIKHSPGKRQTSLDFGFVTPGLLKLAKAKFVRQDHNGTYVFDVTWRDPDDTSRHRVWIDPKTKIIEKREWYNQEGKLMATFLYKGAAKAGKDIYFPTSVEVLNVEGKSAGQTAQTDFAVNQNPPDSLFSW